MKKKEMSNFSCDSIFNEMEIAIIELNILIEYNY